MTASCVHQGCCLDLLPRLAVAQGGFDHVITDPPYEDVHHARHADGAIRRTDGRAAPRAVRFAGIDAIRAQAAAAMVEASRGWVLAFCLAEGVKPWHDALTAAGARWHGTMVWIKPDATPQFAGCGPARGFECIAVAWAGPGRRRWNGGGRRGVLTCPTAKGGYVAAKPVALMRGLVDLFTQSGDHICDPFMGSGSTGVAALEMGRRFTGIDCEGEAVRLAKARLASAACRPALPLSGPRPVQAGLDLGEGWS